MMPLNPRPEDYYFRTAISHTQGGKTTVIEEFCTFKKSEMGSPMGSGRTHPQPEPKSV